MTIHSNKSVVLGSARGVRASSLVRGVSGLPAGWRGSRGRRGATLILIIGALALLSVVVLSYFLIGKGDRRTGATVVRKDSIQSTVNGIGSYIATEIVANDVFSLYVEGENPDFNPANQYAYLVREAWDYPYIDPQRRSVPELQNPGWTPGTWQHDRARFDARGTVPSSFVPQLGPDQNKIEPFPGSDPWLASLLPTCLNPEVDEPRFDSSPALDSILENSRDWRVLSNIAPDGRYVNLWNLRGNVDAGSGFTGNNGADNDNNPANNQISNNLTLMNDLGQSIYPLGSQQTDFGIVADPNIPAHWSTRQQRAFRPVGSAGLDFTDPGYPDYQWADTDGDGFYDARWCELVDATDPLNPLSVLPRDGRYRWFVAARIVDLSGMVNVNVATDQALVHPDPFNNLNLNFGVNRDYPIGMTPADIDLRNLLTLANQKQLYGLLDTADGYSRLQQGQGPDDYSAYVNISAPNDVVAHRTGAFGYNGIAATIGGVLTPKNDVDLSMLPPIQTRARYDYYRLNGGFAGGESGFNGVDRATVSGLFGLPDLVELLTYRGVNDPANRSRLERSVGGRDYGQALLYSPLRDNRSLEVERALAPSQYGQASLEALMWSALDLRQLLTTVSGARPLRSVRLSYNPSIFKDVVKAGSELSNSKNPSDNSAVNEVAISAQAALAQAEVLADPFPLFRAYCDVLLPFSADLRAWDVAGSSTTLAYGYNPEAALRMAAAVTANQIDLYDTDDVPSVFTVLLDGSPTGRAAAANTSNYPWWSEANNSGRLDLDDGAIAGVGTRLTDNAANNVTTAAINVFGIEAQPFITEVATFIMYTDAPVSAGGDDEQNNVQRVTIRGQDDNANSDFLFQCVAFQLNNPFNEEVKLGTTYTGAASDDYDYYFEFGDRRYPIVQLNDDGTQSAISLDPHETRVFYFLSQPKSAILTRMKNADGAIDDLADPDTSLSRWIDEQLATKFGNTASPVQIPTVLGLNPLVQKLLNGTAGQPNDFNREARLWRVLRTAIDDGLVNSLTNDLLADRIRDPGTALRPTLDRRLATGNQQVVDSVVAPPNGDPDDTGYSITLWGSIRRPDDPKDTEQAGIVPRGALPAWCIERKYGEVGVDSLNLAETCDVNLNNLLKNDFVGTPQNPGETTLAGLLDDQDGGGYNLIDTLQSTAEDKNNQDGGTHISVTLTEQIDSLRYDDLYPEAHLENDRFRNANFESTLRPGDMLLALGVCAWHDPSLPAVDPNDLEDLGDDRWTTLGESLAMALGYSRPPNMPQYAPYADMYSNPQDSTAHPLGKTDRGALRLDAFVPFVNNDNDPLNLFDPTVGDERRGLGVPLALGVFDVFTTLDAQFGSVNRATVGVINLNTAAEMAIRALPMASPTADIDYLNTPQYWWPGGPHDNQNDIATTIVAYRDKTSLVPRGLGTSDVSFVGAANIPGYYNPDPLAGPVELYGRDLATEIQGIREEPGFMSKGEMMAARDRLYAPLGQPNLHNIDHLGFDRFVNPGQGSTNKRGVDSVIYTEPLVANSQLDDQIQDDNDEKLAIANAMANSVSVRSDIFAATFMVHGYQKSDCTGLTDRDPLVPSVARRYLMVIDRSNVVKTGDKPRVLVFKELPLK